MQRYEQIATERRKELGWTQHYLAELYGNILQGQPVTREAIANMEKHGLPKDPQRRAILAAILGLPLATLGVEPTSQPLETLINPCMKTGTINLKEYRSALNFYDKSMVGDGYNWTEAVTDILSRIQTLHNKAWYAGGEKIEMIDLLCGFHLIIADISSEQRLTNTVESYNSAITLAREYQLPQQYAYAMHRRGIFFEHIGNPEAATKDHHKALTIKNLPPQLRGLILEGTSRAHALCGQYREALSMSDEAEQFIADNPSDEGPYYVKFDENRWRLGRAAVHVGSRYPDASIKELEQVTFPDESRLSTCRELEGMLIQAKAQIDKKEYPFATQLASDAIVMMRDLHAYTEVPDVEKLHTALRETKYGQSKAVLTLGVDLLKVQHPDLFMDIA